MWFQVNLYLPMRAMYILINRGKQGATMSRKKVSILCSHINTLWEVIAPHSSASLRSIQVHSHLDRVFSHPFQVLH